MKYMCEERCAAYFSATLSTLLNFLLSFLVAFSFFRKNQSLYCKYLITLFFKRETDFDQKLQELSVLILASKYSFTIGNKETHTCLLTLSKLMVFLEILNLINVVFSKSNFRFMLLNLSFIHSTFIIPTKD